MSSTILRKELWDSKTGHNTAANSIHRTIQALTRCKADDENAVSDG
jgi:hypothetical protein